jgi:PadR family transcriptional regulator, regulatory protein PadR
MLPKTQSAELVKRLSVDLRRGATTLVVLSLLRSATYGYLLLQRLEQGGVATEQATLYPLLRRLEEQGLLESLWSVEGARPRKYYRLSASGHEVLVGLGEQWHQLVSKVDGVLASEPEVPAQSRGEAS